MRDHTEVENRTAPLVPRVRTPVDDSERSSPVDRASSHGDAGVLHEEVGR